MRRQGGDQLAPEIGVGEKAVDEDQRLTGAGVVVDECSSARLEFFTLAEIWRAPLNLIGTHTPSSA